MSRDKLILSFWAAFITLGLVASAPASNHNGINDLNIVVAVDCSYSVDAQEYALQIKGIADVFADPEIAHAIEQGPRGSIGVQVVQWSSRDVQIVTVPWTRITSRQQALAFSDAVRPQQRQTAEAGTAIGSVLTFSHRQLNAAPFRADRQVIDIIADGKDNYTTPVTPVRNTIVAASVTINALAVRNQIPDLHTYLYDRVIGGEGAFVENADDYEKFAPAFKRKLLREIKAGGLVGMPSQRWAFVMDGR